MRIDESKLNIPSTWVKVYEKENYRRYDRIKYMTDVDTELGRLGIMISVRRTQMMIHAFVDGYYLKYTKQSSDYNEVRKYIRYVLTRWYKFYVRRILEYQNEEIIPYEYFRTMDKISSIAGLRLKNRKRLVEHYLLSQHKNTKYVVFDCINMLVNRDNDITDIEGRLILQLGAMTNAVSLDFPIIKMSISDSTKACASMAANTWEA